MSLFGGNGRHRKRATIGLAALLVAGGLATGAVAISGGNTEAAAQESCQGLDTALRNNLTFIAAQQTAPDAQSEARIANRQAVVDLIQQRREAAGCEADVQPVPPAQAPPAEAPPVQAPPAAGEVVCPGSTVTLSGEAGAPAASSSQFPVGTRLTVTNLDNGRSITVEVTSASGSCVLLNDAAFEQVREPGKFLIRRARVERVG